MKRCHRDGFSAAGHKFNFVSISSGIGVYDGADVALLESVLLKVMSQDYRREFFYHLYLLFPGKTVTRRTDLMFLSRIQTVRTLNS